MKLQSFYLPIAIFICVCITFVSVTDAYTVMVARDLLIGTRCRLWVTDQNNKKIAGDNIYHDCEHEEGIKNMTFPDTTNYWIHAKVQASGRKKKTRGPFNENTCFRIQGDVFNWRFYQKTDC
ncbi:unnamed protein product [Rhizophagus irregularis]|uniref:Uncharacterized protein n=1 Tax=Rhizophagus irregularis TaxID=588596 RepID=A0A2I1GJ56_9GLOM|nr:hypothetical protein RhiirA4_461572 [Rhizophagus irregularis]CAB4442221.1 unnamed protein product [Rhizophagus irregularis]